MPRSSFKGTRAVDACNDYYARTEFPSHDGIVEESRRGVEGDWSSYANAQVRLMPYSPLPFSQRSLLALFALLFLPLHSPSPLSPPPVAPLCFLNENGVGPAVSRSSIFGTRPWLVAGSSETGRKTVGLCRFIDDAYRLLALPSRNHRNEIGIDFCQRGNTVGKNENNRCAIVGTEPRL